ncbi:MAG: toll/interleukin-1 receptor domain-containing protein, partial [Clostridia bacterium]|nr:toll/interleukin-1 receptor domain-containing protein [Clostridia bacterium]
EFVEYINKIDVNENYPFIENAIRYIIKELDHPLLLPVGNLIERAANARVIELRLKNDLQSLLETEAAKVQSELFNPNITRDFFIMYSGKDIDKVMELVAFIESQHFTCFVAQRNIRHGRGSQQEYTSILKTAMDNCECIVFVSSRNSRDNSCQALSVEMDYIKREDKVNAPPEMRNMRYTKIPYKYKKRRIEYLIDLYDGSNRYGEDVVKEFFYGLEYVQDDPLNVLKRYRELEDIINGKGTEDTKKTIEKSGRDTPKDPRIKKLADEAKEAFEHKDYIAAAELFEEAANMGDAASLCNLGYCYEVGLGVDRDTKMSANLYRRAANAGNARAQYNLGVCYALGVGVDEDIDQAIEHMSKAAKNGDQKAQQWLKSNR